MTYAVLVLHVAVSMQLCEVHAVALQDATGSAGMSVLPGSAVPSLVQHS